MRKKQILIIIGVLVLLFVGPYVVAFGKYFPILWQIVFNKEIQIKETSKYTNILLLGIGGGAHDGPNLTDTIILANIDQEKNKATLISIPRDLWVPEIRGKLNTAYAIGEDKEKGSGKTLSRAVVSKIIGQPIDYVLRIDFDGFVKAVDIIGGIEVTVDRAFDDFQYPVEEKREDLCGQTLDEATARITTESAQVVFPCRYEHVYFNAGKQHMNGKTALVFVRSRYANGPEGTDFARSKRQEKIISAFKDKVFSIGTFLNPGKVIELFNILQDSIDTDIKEDEVDDFIKLAQKMRNGMIVSGILDTGDESQKRAGLLINPPISEEYGMQWVLSPRAGNGNYYEIQEYVSCELNKTNCTITPAYDNNKRNP